MNTEQPYLITKKVIEEVNREYNPNYGDDRICVCGHAYYRHFDTYEQMSDAGCKYCGCQTFVEYVGAPYKKSFFDVVDAANLNIYVSIETEEFGSCELFESFGNTATYSLRNEVGDTAYTYLYNVVCKDKVLLDYKNKICYYTIESTVIDENGATRNYKISFENDTAVRVEDLTNNKTVMAKKQSKYDPRYYEYDDKFVEVDID